MYSITTYVYTKQTKMGKEEFILNGSDGCKITLPKSEYVKYLNQLLENNLNDEDYLECKKIQDKLNHIKDE